MTRSSTKRPLTIERIKDRTPAAERAIRKMREGRAKEAACAAVDAALEGVFGAHAAEFHQEIVGVALDRVLSAAARLTDGAGAASLACVGAAKVAGPLEGPKARARAVAEEVFS